MGPPAFSPDGKLVAFNPMAPPLANPTQKLSVMNFDSASGAFTNFLTIVDDTGQPAETRPGWPAFLPDGKIASLPPPDRGRGRGKFARGASLAQRSQGLRIHWASTSATGVTPLNPTERRWVPAQAHDCVDRDVHWPSTVDVTIDTDHNDDVNTNYEPTVCPVGSGGYAWVVFTSRRMYGNVATIPPFCSDPRGVDLVKNITTKKLWVAAIDLNPAPGKDPSHPAFYLPGQELLAGNARGLQVLDPCRTDGSSCASGDECCNGYCEANGDGGALICSNTTPTCASTGDKCVTSGDCCDSTRNVYRRILHASRPGELSERQSQDTRASLIAARERRDRSADGRTERAAVAVARRCKSRERRVRSRRARNRPRARNPRNLPRDRQMSRARFRSARFEFRSYFFASSATRFAASPKCETEDRHDGCVCASTYP